MGLEKVGTGCGLLPGGELEHVDLPGSQIGRINHCIVPRAIALK